MYLIKVMQLIFGRISGGSLIATIIACTFFAAISGSGVATIIAIGTIMIPQLTKERYPEGMALGAVTGAGPIGILIPPSAPMVALCVALGTSVGAQFMAGFGPGLLVAAAWSVYAYLASRKLDLAEPQQLGAQEAMRVIGKAIPALLFPVIILGGIYAGIATPTEAAALSVVYVAVVELFVYRTTTVEKIYADLARGLVSSASLVFIMACATVMAWFVTMGMTKKGLWQIARAAAPYTILLAVITLAVAFVPALALWLPGLLLH